MKDKIIPFYTLFYIKTLSSKSFVYLSILLHNGYVS